MSSDLTMDSSDELVPDLQRLLVMNAQSVDDDYLNLMIRFCCAVTDSSLRATGE